VSVLVEALTVIVRVDAIDRCVAGGVAEFARTAPNVTYRSDGLLAAVEFLSPAEVQVFVLQLEKVGLRFVQDGKCQDIAVVDQIRGPTVPCDWLTVDIDARGIARASLTNGPVRTMAVYPCWDPKFTMTFLSDPNDARIKTDLNTGQHFIETSGRRAFLGRAFPEGHPQARLMLAGPRLHHDAKRAAHDALRGRGWVWLSITEVEDPIFHISMRYENQLGLVFVDARWSGTCIAELDDRRRGRLLAYARELKAIPILARCDLFAPIHIRSSGERPSESGGMTISIKEGDLEIQEASISKLEFTNLSNDRPLYESDFDLAARIEISDWEVLDLGILLAMQKLEGDGFHIENRSSELGEGAHILAIKDGETYRIVVGAARYPETDPIFDQNRIMAAAENALIHGGKVAKIAVPIANANDHLLTENARPLFRGEKVWAQPQHLILKIIDPASAFADRAIRIFVSSTFMDFTSERDILAKRVLPELQRRSSERGVSVSLVDLRWGVTRADSSSKRELQTCFREIENAHPFFLALIGERYGSMVSQHALKNLHKVPPWLPTEASITDLEIRYAMLRPNHRNSSALAYYRSEKRGFFQTQLPNVAPAFRPLMQQLAQRGYKLFEIGKNFERDVAERLWALIARHYPEVNTPDRAHNESRLHRQYGLHRATSLPQCCEQAAEANDVAKSPRRTAIQCASSWEASALAGSLALRSRSDIKPIVFDCYLPLTPPGTRLADLVVRLAEFVQRTTGVGGGIEEAEGGQAILLQLKRLEGWTEENTRNVLIVVAETDLLGPDEAIVLDNLRATRRIEVILTRTEGPNDLTDKCSADFRRVQWSDDDRAAFVRRYLQRHGKELDDGDIQRIIQHPMSSDLSFSRIICDQLISWSAFETLSRDLKAYLSVADFNGLAEQMHFQASETVTKEDWDSFVRAVFENERIRTEQELFAEARIGPSSFLASMAIVAPMLDSWAGRVWRHRGQNWSTIAKALLRLAA
jgi:hypothetical protein